MDDSKGRAEGEAKHNEIRCSFCGKHQRNVWKLISGLEEEFGGGERPPRFRARAASLRGNVA